MFRLETLARIATAKKWKRLEVIKGLKSSKHNLALSQWDLSA